MEEKKNPDRDEKPNSSISLIYFVAVFLISSASMGIGLNRAYGLGTIFGYSGRMLLVLFPVFVSWILALTGLVLLGTPYRNRVLLFIKKNVARMAVVRIPGLIFVVLVYLFLSLTRLRGIQVPFLWRFSEFWLFGILGVLGAVFLSRGKLLNSAQALLFSFLLMGFGFILLKFSPEISSSPLAYDWSESSRFYDASLFFSRLVYGKKVALPILDPSRALLQSFPYLIPSLPIWAHRLWRIFLWLGMASFAGLFLAKRLNLQDKRVSLGLILWFVVYTFLCPVYFHLMVIPLVVLAGFDKDRLWRSALFVVLGSIWAGISRVNWFPAAGILAAILYILEVPKGEKKFWAYWSWPLLSVFGGLAVAFGSQVVYVLISGNSPGDFVTSFNSPLYPYRLFPSELYGLGVIAHMLIASLPLWVVIFLSLGKNLKRWWAVRHLALVSILLVLMTAGLVVSMKIGGGNNLHNLDLYLVSLMIITVYIAFDRYQPDKLVVSSRQARYGFSFLTFTALVPLFVLLAGLQPVTPLDSLDAEEKIAELQAYIDQADSQDGEILFIQYRHFLSQKLINHVDLVPEYDKVFLMEMAMSNNIAYLDKFHQDLVNHRFKIIVMEPMYPKKLTTSSYIFAEEHNAWTRAVSLPLLANYQIVLDFSEEGLVVLVPKE